MGTMAGDRGPARQDSTNNRLAAAAIQAPVAILAISPGSPRPEACLRQSANRMGTKAMLTAESMELNHATGTWKPSMSRFTC